MYTYIYISLSIYIYIFIYNTYTYIYIYTHTILTLCSEPLSESTSWRGSAAVFLAWDGTCVRESGAHVGVMLNY